MTWATTIFRGSLLHCPIINPIGNGSDKKKLTLSSGLVPPLSYFCPLSLSYVWLNHWSLSYLFLISVRPRGPFTVPPLAALLQKVWVADQIKDFVRNRWGQVFVSGRLGDRCFRARNWLAFTSSRICLITSDLILEINLMHWISQLMMFIKFWLLHWSRVDWDFNTDGGQLWN